MSQVEVNLQEAAELFVAADCALALTGAGISVESGIPDFRSEGGLWEVFSPEEYATLDAFLKTPEKAWKLYRELGRTIVGKRPNAGHRALARLEELGQLAAVITQNVDALHQAAGSRRVFELHGEHQNLNCVQCGHLEPFRPEHLEEGPVPECASCRFPLKPHVVLFGELVRNLPEIDDLIARCDLLLVVGTSAEVFPAAGFPLAVRSQGGKLIEFNLEGTPLGPQCEFMFSGQASQTLRAFAAEVERRVERAKTKETR